MKYTMSLNLRRYIISPTNPRSKRSSCERQMQNLSSKLGTYDKCGENVKIFVTRDIILLTIGKLEIACDRQHVLIRKCYHTYAMDSLHKIPTLNVKICSLRSGLVMLTDLAHNGLLTSCFCRRYGRNGIWWHTGTHGWRSEGEKGEWRGQPALLPCIGHGLSSITTAEAHISAASSRLN